MTTIENRGAFDRSHLRTPQDWLAFLIGSFFGAGLLPKMPGTWGSLAAIPVAYALHLYYPNPFHPMALGFWLVLFVVGVWASQRLARLSGNPDLQIIVIDEVVGYGITASLCGIHWGLLFVAFLFFRVFDIAKLPPVRQVDRYFKRARDPWAQGFGVMADDLLAGIQGVILLYFCAPSLMEFLERHSSP